MIVSDRPILRYLARVQLHNAPLIDCRHRHPFALNAFRLQAKDEVAWEIAKATKTAAGGAPTAGLLLRPDAAVVAGSDFVLLWVDSLDAYAEITDAHVAAIGPGV